MENLPIKDIEMLFDDVIIFEENEYHDETDDYFDDMSAHIHISRLRFVMPIDKENDQALEFARQHVLKVLDQNEIIVL
jgi:hypothetical protein